MCNFAASVVGGSSGPDHQNFSLHSATSIIATIFFQFYTEGRGNVQSFSNCRSGVNNQIHSTPVWKRWAEVREHLVFTLHTYITIVLIGIIPENYVGMCNWVEFISLFGRKVAFLVWAKDLSLSGLRCRLVMYSNVLLLLNWNNY